VEGRGGEAVALGVGRLGRGVVVVASTRAARGIYADLGGPLLAEGLLGIGFESVDVVVVEDGEAVREALLAAVGEGVTAVVTTGGTGINPTDRTPEMTRSVLDSEIPGLADAVRQAGVVKVPTAALSRGVAGVAGRTLVVNLPGSTGGVKDGLTVLREVLPHAVDQLRGGDHPQLDSQAGISGSGEGEKA
jgi:molybdenum cofactor synthesis domain-containing protein